MQQKYAYESVRALAWFQGRGWRGEEKVRADILEVGAETALG